MRLENVSKSYIKGKEKIKIFDNININFEKGKLYMITGESGSGKSTLINILSMLEDYDEGEYYLDEFLVKNLSDSLVSNIRYKKIGIIFQNYFLNERLTAYENVLIAALLDKDRSKEEKNKKIDELFRKFKIYARKEHFPKELSGGEQQRVCIARALINEPTYILADEPTGSLDEENTKNIMDILKNICEEGKCVIMSTHDKSLIKYADVVYTINNRKLERQ